MQGAMPKFRPCAQSGNTALALTVSGFVYDRRMGSLPDATAYHPRGTDIPCHLPTNHPIALEIGGWDPASVHALAGDS